MGATKALGPDGLTGLFYQNHWHLISDDIFSMVQSFLSQGTFESELNRTHITLIPKVTNPENITQFRPISLCNFSYKIIAKVLANRLKPWLSNIVSEEQTAFISNRQIQDNIFIVQEVIHQLRVRRRKRKFQAILKLDMQKAYDRVEWDFLCDYMLKLGFHEIWVKWIKHCISSVSFSILIKGEPSAVFKPSRGIRQGDPLSPYLFIIMANSLSTLMRKAVQDGNIKGIRLNPTCPTLSHLLFADDAIFFLN